jgi:hypothetical protein
MIGYGYIQPTNRGKMGLTSTEIRGKKSRLSGKLVGKTVGN